jgi:uncharacterized lipoprotein YddW (UPF0748 family)
MADFSPLEHLKPHLLLIFGVFLAAGTNVWSATYQESSIKPPAPVRELRAVWVATVANIDWPSRKGLSTAEQKAELLAIVDRAAQLKLNAIVFQVRPACDALYASEIEPWSEFLTGTMGKAPEPYYDPLAYVIDEAHKRGIELHAWFNPYRAGHPSAKSPVSARHVTRTHPELVRHYGKQVWLDPGEKEVQEYSLSVVMDVVRRYDVDGVHFDDYFYPYKEIDRSGNEMEFPDEASWKRFGAGGKLGRDDWRRENVNEFVEKVYGSIKAAKPWVKFGISPFGIWRPENPPQIRGFDAYSKLYADSRKWLTKGWVDYFAPQLYWSISSEEQSFPVLLKWWSQQNSKGRHLLPGLDVTKTVNLGSDATAEKNRKRWSDQEILNQIRLTRKQSGVDGHIHWNMKSLMRNQTLDDALETQLYTQPALVPASPWLGGAGTAKPALTVAEVSATRLRVTWTATGANKPWLWLVQARNGREWRTEILSGEKSSATWTGDLPEVVAISAVDRNGNISNAAAVNRRESRTP